MPRFALQKSCCRCCTLEQYSKIHALFTIIICIIMLMLVGINDDSSAAPAPETTTTESMWPEYPSDWEKHGLPPPPGYVPPASPAPEAPAAPDQNPLYPGLPPPYYTQPQYPYPYPPQETAPALPSPFDGFNQFNLTRRRRAVSEDADPDADLIVAEVETPGRRVRRAESIPAAESPDIPEMLPQPEARGGGRGGGGRGVGRGGSRGGSGRGWFGGGGGSKTGIGSGHTYGRGHGHSYSGSSFTRGFAIGSILGFMRSRSHHHGYYHRSGHHHGSTSSSNDSSGNSTDTPPAGTGSEDNSWETVVGFLVVALLILHIVSAILVLIGVQKRRRKLLLPNMVILFLHVPITIALLASLTLSAGEVTAVIVLFTGLSLISCWHVYSLFVKFGEEDDKKGNDSYQAEYTAYPVQPQPTNLGYGYPVSGGAVGYPIDEPVGGGGGALVSYPMPVPDPSASLDHHLSPTNPPYPAPAYSPTMGLMTKSNMAAAAAASNPNYPLNPTAPSAPTPTPTATPPGSQLLAPSYGGQGMGSSAPSTPRRGGGGGGGRVDSHPTPTATPTPTAPTGAGEGQQGDTVVPVIQQERAHTGPPH